ncbi:calcium binding protein [Streptomyces sp. 3212.3]|uniref:calcium-binding protein n=1 Tax=unclassified Streptomyces TaxID=2593676 RepID=UPI000740F2AF|nr:MULTISPECIES: calcium-binding protein [unclassified Streptomyces]KUJ56910.1 hypothetical protein ADL25_04805 [Streptomyces sp. NRRL F-5122]REE58981.1 calcium binding protein [Streptomyces sp. 3212.3]
MIRLSSTELDALVAEAIVDAYGEDEQCAAFQTFIEDCLALPFSTVVLGVTVTVTSIQDRPGSGITALCRHGRHTQAIGILDLPPPDPTPEGWAWVEAYRHWES